MRFPRDECVTLALCNGTSENISNGTHVENDCAILFCAISVCVCTIQVKSKFYTIWIYQNVYDELRLVFVAHTKREREIPTKRICIPFANDKLYVRNWIS